MNSRQHLELAALCRTVRWDVDMAAYSTFRTGGIVEALAETGTVAELATLLRWLHRERIPWHVIGGGSNILVTGRYHEGVFIRLRGMAQDIVREQDGDAHLVRASAGCGLAALLGWCARGNLGGLEFMAGIPGSVGGAIRMNAGAFGRTIGDMLAAVHCLNERGEAVTVAREEAVFAYRSTRLPGEPQVRLLITGGVFRLAAADGGQVTARCRDIIAQRRGKQPQGVGSAGSFFKNPQGDFAGRLIEQAGLKGLTLGRAMVSPKHANFIVNTGGAVPEDIVALMEAVRQKVFEHSGVLLEPEVRIY
ncbi:UDP-N-acetylmuramate dehydrogenase [Desulfobulbus elongatus]|uniref:UDP-N-acetylmuramate dehydrogenase n=1 Tax=Desulfobulbus elongatus TaxID=53332 RepID=UPI000488BCA0|nr:UDP-N-acetylmuramate dehydrogenase [Desulfobulbus elongatus]